MSWTCFRLRLRMKSDMHCGSLVLGFVARTFPYVPQHLPVYAAVPAAVAALDMPDEPLSYRTMEELLFSNMRSSPFFVLDDDESPLFPWKEEQLAKLESSFMGSRYGVRLDHGSRSAEENMLFETEVLLAHRREHMQYTRLEGYVWLRKADRERARMDSFGISLDNGRKATWPEIFGRMSLGGDRTRNLGRLWPDAEMTEAAALWQDINTLTDGNWPQLHIPKGTPCPVALAADGKKGKGGFAVMTGRRIQRGGSYAMDCGGVAHEIGWCPEDRLTVELSGERCAQALP